MHGHCARKIQSQTFQTCRCLSSHSLLCLAAVRHLYLVGFPCWCGSTTAVWLTSSHFPGDTWLFVSCEEWGDGAGTGRGCAAQGGEQCRPSQAIRSQSWVPAPCWSREVGLDGPPVVPSSITHLWLCEGRGDGSGMLLWTGHTWSWHVLCEIFPADSQQCWHN